MEKTNSTTRDLAKLVFFKLQGAKVNSLIPNEEALNLLFENLFYASIKTEESDFIKVTVTLINSRNPDPSPPKRIVENRWRYIHFNQPIDFNVKNIVKLSKAADPWSSSLAVDFNDKNELFIWGMIDQAVHYQSYLHYEAESGPEQPGLFQITVTDIGSLVVIIDYELIATLKQNVLISNYIDVFQRGPIAELIESYSLNYLDDVRKFAEANSFQEDFEFLESLIYHFWEQVISRVLIRIQSYQHGGAFIITNDLETDLDIKHKLDYDRLYTSLCKIGKVTIEIFFYGNIIFNEYTDENKDSIPVSMYLEESVSEFTKRETNDEIKGAIRFIASLSCIDGLVVFSSDLKVKGFGAVINNIQLPEYIYLSTKASISDRNLTQVNPNNFGTRHRSMFSYCWKHEGCVGFVVSQDGDIRAITKVGNKLIMWENIKVQRLHKSNKLKRRIKAKNKK